MERIGATPLLLPAPSANRQMEVPQEATLAAVPEDSFALSQSTDEQAIHNLSLAQAQLAQSSVPVNTEEVQIQDNAVDPEAIENSFAAPEESGEVPEFITDILPSEIAGVNVDRVIGAANGPDLGPLKTVDILSTLADELGLPAAAGAAAGIAGYATIGVGTVALGGYKISQGIKQHDKEQIVDGAGDAIGGASNGMAAVTIAAAGAKGAGSVVGQVASKLITPLALVSGAVDAGLGVKELADGVKEKSGHKIASGVLNTGFGVAMAASAVGGGVPAIIIAGVLWVAQFGVNMHAKHQEKQALAQAQALQIQPAPNQQPDPSQTTSIGS